MKAVVDMRQLRSYALVIESGSMSKAAERLCIAQPALSRQIRLLEESMGTQLLVRHARGVVATPAGDVLYQRAGDLLREAARLKEDVAATTGRVTGSVVLGLIPSVAGALCGGIIQRYRERFPGVRLTVEESMSGSLRERIVRNEVDLAILYALNRWRNIRSTPLMKEKLYLVGPAGSPQAGAASCTLRKALRLRMALPGKNHGLRILVEKAAAEAGQAVILDTEVNALPLQIDLVRRGLAHTILPVAAVSGYVQRKELSACCITSPGLERHLVLASPSDRPGSLASMELERLIIADVQKMIACGEWPGASC